MVDKDASLAVKWFRSTTAQGVALGCVLGPVGALLAFLFSAGSKRAERTFGALKGSVAASVVILVVFGIVVLAISVF